MMEQEKVTVLMAVYNGHKERISLAIQSILDQTYRNFEFLIINDGSNEQISLFLKDFAQKDARICLVRNRKNQGLIYSLNRGLRLAKTEWIVRMDADDFSLPNRIRVQMQYLKKHPNVKVLGTGYKDLKTNRILQSQSLQTSQLLSMTLWNSPLCHPSVVMHKDTILNVGGYPNYKYVRDYALWSVLLYKHNVDIAVIPDILLAYRTVDGKAKYGNVQQKNHLSVVRESLQTLNFPRNIQRIVFAGWEKFRCNDPVLFQKNVQTLKNLQSIQLPVSWDRDLWQELCRKRLKRVIRGYHGAHALIKKIKFYLLKQI